MAPLNKVLDVITFPFVQRDIGGKVHCQESIRMGRDMTQVHVAYRELSRGVTCHIPWSWRAETCWAHTGFKHELVIC